MMPSTVPTTYRRRPRYVAGIEIRDGDLRTVLGRRLKHLIQAYSDEIGPDLSETDKALVRQVCSLQLRIERLQSAILEGGDVSSDEIIRLSSEHRRLLTSLSTKSARAKPAGQTALQDYLATRAAQAEEEAENAEGVA
jgi:hypothetical protein